MTTIETTKTLSVETLAARGRVGLSLRRDGKHERLALRLTDNGSASIDVLREDGTLLCRLNLFEFPERAGDVDVILDPETQRGTFLAWPPEQAAVRVELSGVTAYAVDIKPAGRAGARG